MDLGGGYGKGVSLRAEDSRSSWSMSNGGESEDRDQASGEKSCADCRTTKTPLWRAGPSGPKSLCNACGIRYRKKMVSVMRVSKGNETSKSETTQTHSDVAVDNKATTSSNTTKTGESLKVKLNLMALVKKHRCQRNRKLAEEEEAAVLLMALSCGSVFA